ncbi:MAG: AAA family ATPase [Ruminococcus sp.]|nr:AAA family ATPase [Ruminococcus sp.]
MKGIHVKGLFGRFDYDIQLAEGSTTILTGPNGFGKSTILQCIYAVANSDLEFFLKLDFKEIEILMLDEEENLQIVKCQDNLVINGQEISAHDIIALKKNRMRDHPVYIMEGTSGKISEKIVRRVDTGEEIVSQTIYSMCQKIGEIRFIKEQRLIREDDQLSIRQRNRWEEPRRREVQIVDQIPLELMSQIRKASQEYSKVANDLDSTFPQRLFNERNKISEEQFNQKLAVMQKKMENLQKYGISNIGKLGAVQFNEEDARALKVYFEDFDEKYKSYESLIKKLDMFTEIVNRKFLFKKMKISEKELVVLDEDNPEKELALSQLSSGEKETVVLFYQLLFDVPDNVILLVDEPEISLHVAWQREFAEDIKTVVESKGITALIATHSPQFINGNRGIQIDLGELYTNGLDKK